MEHPDLLLDLFQLRHQDQMREVETWRLAMSAQPSRVDSMSLLLRRLVAATRQRLQGQALSQSVKSDLGGTGQIPML